MYSNHRVACCSLLLRLTNHGNHGVGTKGKSVSVRAGRVTREQAGESAETGNEQSNG